MCKRILFFAAALLFILAAACRYTAGYEASPTPVPRSWNTSGAGEVHLTYRTYEQTYGRQLRAMRQGSAPSCVGASAAKALEIRHGLAFDASYLYGVSRLYGNANPYRPGAHCKHAAAACEHYGALPAWDMALLGIDLSKYNSSVANQYGPRGPPATLLGVASFFKTSGHVRIQSTTQLRGALAHGYPAIVGSQVGFGPTTTVLQRTPHGFLHSKWFSRWAHAMVFIGVDDRPGRPGFLVLNSWGDVWVRGPRKFGDEPAGSFWVSFRDAAAMISYGDTYVMYDISGLR